MEQLGFAQQQGSSGGAALSTSKSSTSFGEEIADSDMNRQGRELTLQLLTKKKHQGQSHFKLWMHFFLNLHMMYLVFFGTVDSNAMHY